MSEESNKKENPVKALRDSYNKRREETLKRAQENAKKILKPKKDEQVARPARSSRKDLEL